MAICAALDVTADERAHNPAHILRSHRTGPMLTPLTGERAEVAHRQRMRIPASSDSPLS